MVKAFFVSHYCQRTAALLTYAHAKLLVLFIESELVQWLNLWIHGLSSLKSIDAYSE